MTYPRTSLGHILQALRDWGIPETIAGSVTVGLFDSDQNKRDRVFYGGQLFAEYKYLDGIEQPLFRWHQHALSYGTQRLERQEDGSLKPKFRLSLGPHGHAALIIQGHEAVPELHAFLDKLCPVFPLKKMRDHPVPTEPVDAAPFNVVMNSGACFQGGQKDPNGNYFYIEFWRPEGAQAFVDYVNENYKPPR